MSSRCTRVRAAISGVGLVVSGLALFPASAGAAPGDVEIQVTGAVYGNPGDVLVVQEVAVDPALVGATCTGVAITQNNESVHPDTDLIISTGGTQSEFDDVESVSDGTTEGSEQLVLGSTITVSVRLGADGVASGGTMLSLDCQAIPPTTTTTTTTPTTVPPSTAPPTTAPTATVPPTTTVPSTVPTTTPEAPPTTSEVGQEVVTNPGTNPQLPFTGSRATGPVVAVGVALLLVGLLLRRVPRRD
jgi:hypothetical protein